MVKVEGNDPGTIAFSSDNKECLRIERGGKIVWTVNGEERVCEDFKDLAKAFMYVIYELSPGTDWKGLAPEIYKEIESLLHPQEEGLECAPVEAPKE